MPAKKKNIIKSALLSIGGLALYFSPEITSAIITNFTPDYTLVNEYRVPITFGIGTLLSVFGIRKGYVKDNLPKGLAAFMDRIPNSITGVRGSQKVK